MNLKRNIRLVFIMSILWVTSVNLSAQQPRTFTDRSGRTLVAVPLGLSDGTVEMKRVSDGQVFRIQTSTLSPADQAWLTSWAASSSRAAPGSWSVLRIHMPISKYVDVNRPEVVGLRNDAARVGATTFEVLLPVGAWVKVSARDHTTTGEYLAHLIRYEGEREWKVTTGDSLMMLSRDGLPSKVVGITLPSNNPEDLLSSIDLSRCETKVSLDTNGRHLSLSLLSKFKIGALVVGTTLDAEGVTLAAALNPNAIHLVLTEESAPKIGSFTSLEAMDVRREPACPDNVLGALPSARDMYIHTFAFTPAIQQSLDSNTKLRLFRFLASNAGKGRVPQWKGISKNTSLEALNMLRGAELDAAEVAQLPSLRSLSVSHSVFPPDSGGLPELARLKGLLALTLVASFPQEIFESWTKNGSLDNLVYFASDGAHQVKSFTRLRVLEMDLPQEEHRGIVSAIGDLPDLRSLELSGVGRSDIPALSSAKNKATVESLDLGLRSVSSFGNRETSSGDYPDSKDLRRLSGYTALKRLEVWGGHIKEFDFSQFPKLEVLELRGMNDMKELIGLSTSPTMEALKLYDCDKLTSLGVKAPNTKLWKLELNKCPELVDIGGVQQTSGLKLIFINGCDKIPQPLVVDKTNSYYSLVIRSCALLPDRNEERKGDAP